MSDRRDRILGRVFVSVAVIGTLGFAFVGGSPSGASTLKSSTINKYCESMIADHLTPPTNSDADAYHAWAKQHLKFFEHLQSEANTAIAKRSLRVLVPMLKVEATSSNMTSLETYVANHRVTWDLEWLDFDQTVVACAKWVVDLL